MNGFSQNDQKKLSGLNSLYADSYNGISSNNILYLDGLTSNVQTQLNNESTSINNLSSNLTIYEASTNTTITALQNQLNNLTSSNTTGVTYFSMYNEHTGYVNNTTIMGPMALPTCTLVGVSICASSAPTTNSAAILIFIKIAQI